MEVNHRGGAQSGWGQGTGSWAAQGRGGREEESGLSVLHPVFPASCLTSVRPHYLGANPTPQTRKLRPRAQPGHPLRKGRQCDSNSGPSLYKQGPGHQADRRDALGLQGAPGMHFCLSVCLSLSHTHTHTRGPPAGLTHTQTCSHTLHHSPPCMLALLALHTPIYTCHPLHLLPAGSHIASLSPDIPGSQGPPFPECKDLAGPPHSWRKLCLWLLPLPTRSLANSFPTMQLAGNLSKALS
jgi:hypothetical protein